VKQKTQTPRGSGPNSRQTPIKILHCLGTLDPGGVETWLLHLLKSLDTKRFQFDFCTFGVHEGLYAPQVEELGARVLRCPRSQNLWKFGRSFRKIIREGQYDVIHSHVHAFSGVLLRWARLGGVPVRIAHSHNSHDGKSNTTGRRAYRFLVRSWIRRHATHGLAASREAADDIFLDWKNDSRVAILHCGIDLNGFRGAVDRNLSRKKIGLPPGVAVVGHVGNFIPAKNHAFFLEIAAQVRKHRSDTHFLLIGDGPCRAEIEARAGAMGFKENIHFLGTRTDVPTLLRTCVDVFVFPSLLWEGLPLAVVEAQAAGLRCVISNNITDEVVIVPDQVVRLSLASGAAKWATATIEGVDRGKFHAQTAVEFMQQTDFTVEHGLSSLLDIYSAGKAEANAAKN
jgi:glycosyltransferase involved in cell wall biosynthesis